LRSDRELRDFFKKYPFYQIPYPSFLKEDIIIFIQQNLVNKIKAKFKLSESRIKKEKIIEMSNRIYDQIQAYSKELIETENYRVCFMNHDFFSENGFTTEVFSPDIFYGLFPELKGKFTEDEARIIVCLIHHCKIDEFYAKNFKKKENKDRTESLKKELKKIEDIVINKIDEKTSNLKNDIKSDK
jgi:hypothetical protein